MKTIDLSRARQLSDSGDPEGAWRLIEPHLMRDPDDRQALCVAAFVLRKAGRLPMAHAFARRLTQLEPGEATGWINYGQICNELFQLEEGEAAYREGLKVACDPTSLGMLYTNLSALLIDHGRFAEALPLTDLALKATPESKGARANRGFCQLALKNYAEGWKNYRACVGTSSRRKVQYKGEPEWDGSPGKKVVLYGEQGLGDEICFASMVPDALKDCAKVVLDVDARLTGLFRRSFPTAVTYGTRHATAADGIRWAPKDCDFDASLSLGCLGEYYRTSAESFPSTPYLLADPERVLMWKALFSSKAKPVIGIAWTGGTWSSGSTFRQLKLAQLRLLFEAIDAHWVSLQYKDAQPEIDALKGVDIRQYPQATLTKDYDDTAALVASLDMVVSIPTAVVHLAGALGTPCIAMNSPAACWKFTAGLPFHPGVEIVPHRQNWGETVRHAAECLARFRQQVAA